jgi:hypothetical protein
MEEVQLAMDCFRRSSEMSHGDSNHAYHDLALMLIDVGDYMEGLQHLYNITQTFPPAPYFTLRGVYEQAAIAVQALAVDDGEGDTEPRVEVSQNFLQETASFFATFSLVLQCWLILSEDSVPLTQDWSIQSLQKCLRLQTQEFYGSIAGCGREEKLLLKSLKKADNLSALSDLSPAQASNDAAIEREIRRLLAAESFADALLLQALLGLKEKQNWEVSDSNETIKLFLRSAQNRWQKVMDEEGLRQDDLLARFNIATAHMLFRRAFHTAMAAMTTPGALDDTAGSTAGEDNLSFGATALAEPSPPSDTSPEVQDEFSLPWHVLVVHDPRDPEAERDVAAMDMLLKEVCGLVTSRASEVSGGDEGQQQQGSAEGGKGAATAAMKEWASHSVLVVCVTRRSGQCFMNISSLYV